jgi:16S rRNA (cytosine967-C5)-methyltransferase
VRKRIADQARRVAFDAVRAVHADGAYANLVLGQLVNARHLNSRDAAFATELVSGTSRMEGTYDLIIAAAAGRKLTSFQPAVLDLLRLGTHQLLAMRVPVHAAVAATVDLASVTVGERVTGLTNAVLRKVAARDYDEWTEQLTAGLDPSAAMAIRTAHPRWVLDAYADVLPADQLETALLANNVSPAVSLAVRPGLATVDELVTAGALPGRYSPFAASWTGNPGDLAAVRDGTAGVQDEGSQLVAVGLSRAVAEPGWWLDLCAGPGGKSALLTGLAAHDGSRLLANEISPHRADLVAGAVRAYQDSDHPASLVIADGTRPAWTRDSFSRVLVDAPCSGLGALRRRPESRWRRELADVEGMHSLQTALLQTALDSAAPGGVVAYVTCSPHVRETTDVVADVVAGRDDAVIEDAAPLFPELVDADRGPFLQLWPHRHGTDAMFAAFLRKGSAADRDRPSR